MPRVKRNSQDEYTAPFATRLRELIDTSKIPQTALAEYIGVTRQAVSSYSLGTSLPDVEKFEKIANYFDVSTEYLLGRTEIKKADASKQATAEYLGLSEDAIDAIHSLQGIHFEQNPENDYKITVKPTEPLPGVFSLWLATVDLPLLISDICRTIGSTTTAQDSGWHNEKYQLEESHKETLTELRQHGIITLSMTQQVNFFSQSATDTFNKSLDRLITQVIKVVNEANQPQEENDVGRTQ